MASVSLKHIYKIYQGGVKAVSDFNLDIDDKEFVVFVGPSGCGKSTTLRMVAGLEEISAGELYIDGKLVNDVEPKDRDIAMVFQNYALYPHMTVYDNMAFGLRLRKMNSAEIDSRVKEAAQILGITQLLSRKPKALSGGQRQRVALGRAIVREPKVFLLDEPLSNLDAKLRVQMRTEITKLHNKLATTFIYVTHDQTEAMTMGTRIVVMKDGIIQQVDTPQCLYDNPENLFVASFLGSPQMNFFKATLVKEGDTLYAVFGNNKIAVPKSKAKRIIDDSVIGSEVILGVRPEDIHNEQLFIEASPNTVIEAEIDVIEKLGNETILYMKVDGKEDYTIARIDARSEMNAGETVKLAVDANHIHFFDPDTEMTLMGVPKVNLIKAKLLAEKDGLCVRFGNYKIDLPESVTNRLTEREVINGDVELGIAPGDFNLQPVEGGVEVQGEVDFTVEYPRFTAAYMHFTGKDGFIVVKLPIDTDVSAGNKMSFYINPETVQLYNIDSGEKMIAIKPITYNTTTAMVTVKDNVAVAQIGKNKLAFATTPQIRESGSYEYFHISPKAVLLGKENIAKQPKCVMSGYLEDADTLGEYTLLYLKVDGFEPYFTAAVKGDVSFNIGDKVKFAIDPAQITGTKTPSLKEYIAQMSEVAPVYVFVEEKKVKAAEETAASVDKAVAAEKSAKPAAKTAAAKPAAKKPAAKTATKKPTAKK